MERRMLTAKLLVFVSFGTMLFLSKLSADRIGVRSALWMELGFIPAVVLMTLLSYSPSQFLGANRWGVGIAIAAGAIGSVGAFSQAWLLARADASSIAPLTALYPVLTSVLAVALLHEPVTVNKVLGIVLSVLAIYLLGKA